ncbi:ABC transporter substrate-binding protein [Halostreptopolyspora alba]|uniref:ABC transporter substrate-binding protein n=1 Tax=Halostreptopolyspora alba TaxID=2487137 RepID=A0A3N0EG91_9ACTN|nr:ABC transporter substrate-binding protein [Nocardiopsaceae bacterium YIM 96095]
MRRSTPLLAGIALVLATTACDSSGGDDSGDPIQVGYITPLTGDYSALGTDNEKAVEYAVEEVNSNGGVLGRDIELITRDDQSNPDQAILGFNEIMNEEPAAIIGSAFSNSAMALLEQVEREEVPYISPTPADEQVDPVNDHVFVIPAIAGTYAERALQYFSDEDMTDIAVAYSETSYGLAGYEAMSEKAEEYGIDLVVEQEFEQDSTDFGHIISDVENSDADAMITWATGPPGVIMTEQYADAELDTPLVMTGSQASHLWTEPAGEATEGVTVLSSIGVVGDYLPAGHQKEVIVDLAEGYSDEHGEAPPQFAQDGYSAVQVLVSAIEEADSADPADIRDALENLSVTTPNGTFEYSEEDHAGLGPEAVSVNTVQDSEFVPTEWAIERFDEAYGEDGEE